MGATCTIYSYITNVHISYFQGQVGTFVLHPFHCWGRWENAGGLMSRISATEAPMCVGISGPMPCWRRSAEAPSGACWLPSGPTLWMRVIGGPWWRSATATRRCLSASGWPRRRRMRWWRRWGPGSSTPMRPTSGYNRLEGN